MYVTNSPLPLGASLAVVHAFARDCAVVFPKADQRQLHTPVPSLRLSWHTLLVTPIPLPVQSQIISISCHLAATNA